MDDSSIAGLLHLCANFIFKIRYAHRVLQKLLKALAIRRIHEQRWNLGVPATRLRSSILDPHQRVIEVMNRLADWK